MSNVIMPKATAIWLVDNTGLTFEQISNFTGMHLLEVQAIADGEGVGSMIGQDPTQNNQLTKEEIERCEKNPNEKLKAIVNTAHHIERRTKGPKYTPISKRSDKPDAIAYLVKNHPELSDSQIVRLVGTTKNTINSIRERTYWNMVNIKPSHPLELGLCRIDEFNKELAKAQKNKNETAPDVEKAV